MRCDADTPLAERGGWWGELKADRRTRGDPTGDRLDATLSGFWLESREERRGEKTGGFYMLQGMTQTRSGFNKSERGRKKDERQSSFVINLVGIDSITAPNNGAARPMRFYI